MKNGYGVTNLELLLDLRQFLHLLPQFEGGHDGVGAGQRHVGGAGQCSVGVEARPRALQRVVVLLGDAVGALARDGVRPLDGVVARQEHLDDLVVVVVCREDQWRNVRRELALLVRTKERVLLRPTTQLGAGDVVRMLDNHLTQTHALSTRLKRPRDRLHHRVFRPCNRLRVTFLFIAFALLHSNSIINVNHAKTKHKRSYKSYETVYTVVGCSTALVKYY